MLGRELFTPDEVRKLDNKKCIIFIRGFNPVVDNKFVPFTHPAFNQTADGKGKPYVHETSVNGRRAKLGYRLLGQESMEYYKGLKEQGKPVFIEKLSAGELQALSRIEMERSFLNMDEEEHKENTRVSLKDAVKKARIHRRKPEGGDSLMNRMAQWHYSEEQKAELHKMTALGMPKETILAVFYPETDVEILKELQKTYQVAQNTVS